MRRVSLREPTTRTGIFTRRGIVKVPYNPALEKYWHQRRTFFKKRGASLDDAESWFSVTPEAVAKLTAETLLDGTTGGLITIDPFVGAGSNAIQQAIADPTGIVIAIDIDPVKVAMAKKNAELYGVGSNIEFIVGDATQLLSSRTMRGANICLLSPPWGGIAPAPVGAASSASSPPEPFRLSALEQPCDGMRLFELADACAPCIAYYLPANADDAELEQLARQHASGACEKIELAWGGGSKKPARVRAILALFHAEPPSWLRDAGPGLHSRRVAVSM